MSRGVAKILMIAVPALALLGLLIATVMRWRETANRTRCQDNLRRLGWFAMWQYTDREFAFPGGPDFKDRVGVLRADGQPDPDRTFPPGTLANAGLTPEKRLSWQVILLPQVGRDDIYKLFDTTRSWDDPANAEAITAKVPVLACPSLYEAPAPGTPQLGTYIGMAGLGADAPRLPPTDARAGFFRYDEPTRSGMVKRGFSHTMTIIESPRESGPWAAGGPPTVRGVDPADQPYIGAARQFGGHPAGCNTAYADGSVRFIASSISPRVFEMMVTLTERGEP